MPPVSASVAELEPNDDFSSVSADTKFGVVQSASLSGFRDVDFFRFTPSAPGLIAVNLSAGDGGAARFELTLFAPNGTPVEGSTQTVQGSDSLLFYADDVTGGVSIRVSATSSESNLSPAQDGEDPQQIETPYTFTANWFAYAPPGTEQEPNDFYADPLISEQPGPVAGTVSDSSDEDWFYVDVEAASNVSFAVLLAQAPTAGSKPIYAAAYNADGEFLAGRDLTDENSVITFTAEKPGSVFFALTPGETFQTAVSYSIAAAVSPIPVVYPTLPSEPGSVPAATPIEVNDRAVGVVFAGATMAGMIPVYSFSVAPDETRKLDLNFDPSTDVPGKQIFIVELSRDGHVLESLRTGEDASISLTEFVSGASDTLTMKGAGNYLLSVTPGPDAPDAATFGVTVRAQPLPPVIVPATWTGTSANDVYPPANGNNGGSDRVDLVGGADTIDGGSGNDTAIFRVASDALAIQTVAGITAVTGAFNADSFAYKTSLLLNVERIETLNGAVDLPPSPAIRAVIGRTKSEQDYGFETIAGTSGDDVINGMGGDDRVDGGAGNDTLVVFAKRTMFDIQSTAGVTLLVSVEPTVENFKDLNGYENGIQVLTNVENLAFLPDAGNPGNDTVSLVAATSGRLIRFGTNIPDSRETGQPLIGTAQSELFVPLFSAGGADEIDGGAGNDAVLLFGPAAMYDVSTSGATTTVRAKLVPGSNLSKVYVKESVYALTRVEKILFADSEVDVQQAAGISLIADDLVVTEGGTLTVSVVLDSAPASDVSIALTSGLPVDVGFGNPAAPSTQAVVSFNATNWNTPQAVTVAAGPEDALPEVTKTASISAAVKSGTYSAAPASITLRVLDNDAPKQSITGRVFQDANGNGSREATESGLEGWKVFADTNRNGKLDTGEPQALSDAQGDYSLLDLPTGQTVVMAEIPTGWARSAPGISRDAGAVVIERTGDPGRADAPIPKGSVEILSGGATGAAPEAASPYANLGLAQKIADFHTQFPTFTGKGYTTVVIDTGADLDHGDFGPASLKNGVMVADRIVYQYNFVGANSPDANETPDGGHGTHVAGTIVSSNPKFLGMAPEANLIVLKVLGEGGSGSGQDIIEAVDWVVQNGKQYNVVSVNMSLGDSSWSTTPMQGYLNTQFEALAKQGIVVLAASGNSYGEKNGNDAGVGYPSSDSWAMSIGSVIAGAPGTPNASDDYPASRPIDTLSSFSQRGPLTVAVAPGDKIGAAWLDNGHAYIQGTSMATPEVSGTVLLMQQMADSYLGRRLTWEEVKAVLQKTGDPVVDTEQTMQDGELGNTGLTYQRINLIKIEAEIKGMLKSPDASTISLTAGDAKTLNLGFTATAPTLGTMSANSIVGTRNDDQVDAGAGNDSVDAGGGDDVIDGGSGDDILRSSDGSDSIGGGEGNDLISVEGANNQLTGGEGNDGFLLNRPSGSNTIEDFGRDDYIDFDMPNAFGAGASGAPPVAINSGTGAGLGLGGLQVQRDGTDAILYLGTDATPGYDAKVLLKNVPPSASFSVDPQGVVKMAVGAEPLSPTGKAYHWNSHILLDDVTVQTRTVQDAAGASSTARPPIEFRNAQADTNGKMTAELWVRAEGNTGSLQFDFAFNQGATFNFDTSTGSIKPGWTSVANPIGNAAYSWGWIGDLTTQSLTTGEHRIGVVSIDAPGFIRPWLQVIDSEIGTRTVAPIGLGVTDRQGVYALKPQEASALLLELGSTVPSGKAVTASDALAALKLAVGRNPNTSISPDAAPLPVSPYQLMSADVDRNGKVTAADALNVLKMAVGRADAPAPTWGFVPETADYWDETSKSFSVSRKAVPTDINTTVVKYESKPVNWVGFIQGDVDGSWKAPAQAGLEAPQLQASYFTTLADSLEIPAYQFGLHG